VGDRIAPRSAAQVLPQTGIPGGLVAELLAAAALLSGGLLLVRRRRTPREDQG
jgi:LPXTG-motif cell wall-anchored protein